MIIQIYEVQTPDEAKAMVELGVDHIGSVVQSEAEWKQASIKETISVVEKSLSKSSLILLFHQVDTVMAALDYYEPDIVHFCDILVEPGRDDGWEKRCLKFVGLQEIVKKEFPEIKVMRSLPVPDVPTASGFPLQGIMDMFTSVSDYFLIDTYVVNDGNTLQQPENGFIGITGKTCDFQTAASLIGKSEIPVILAGGLSPENVYDAAIATRPAGVDSCTRTNVTDLEGNPIRFKKDFKRVKTFVSEARRAEEFLETKRIGEMENV